MAATHVEKSTVQAGALNAVSSLSAPAAVIAPATVEAAAPAALEAAVPATDIKFCAIDDPGCEACQ
jgi:ribonucleoside-diphosphate reductase alpha chain